MIARRDVVEKLKIELLRSAELLFGGERNDPLLHVLKQSRLDVEFALILNWIPEQGEDIYWLLVDKETILIVDVPRPNLGDSAADVQAVDMHTFRKRKLSAETQRRFHAALEIMDARKISKRSPG